MADMVSTSQRRWIAETNFRCSRDRLQRRLSRNITPEIQSIMLNSESNDVEAMAAELESVIEQFINSRNRPVITDKLGKVKEIMLTWVRASYPFLQIFVSASKTASSMYGTPYGIVCDGLLGLIKVFLPLRHFNDRSRMTKPSGQRRSMRYWVFS